MSHTHTTHGHCDLETESFPYYMMLRIHYHIILVNILFIDNPLFFRPLKHFGFAPAPPPFSESVQAQVEFLDATLK